MAGVILPAATAIGLSLYGWICLTNAAVAVAAAAAVTATTATVTASSLFNSKLLFTPGSGRNIRHLPCVSRRSGETGICMFAFSCAKANGTHLGTCIDRFYFGSCCKIAGLGGVGGGGSDVDMAAALPIDSNQLIEDVVNSTEEPFHISTFQSVQGNNKINNTTRPNLFYQSTTLRTDPDSQDIVETPTRKHANNTTTRPRPTIGLDKFSSSTSTSFVDHTNGISSSTKPFSVTTSKPSLSSSHIITTSKPIISSSLSTPLSQSSSTHLPIISVTTYPPKPQVTTSRPSSVHSTQPNKKPISTTHKPITQTKPGSSTSQSTPKPSNVSGKPKPKPVAKPNNSTTKPVTKPPRPSSKPTPKPTPKPVTRPGSKPTNYTKPISTTAKPLKVSTSSPGQKPFSTVSPSTVKPGGKPPLFTRPQKPELIPGYVEVPVTTFVPSSRPSPDHSVQTISNDILQPVSTQSPATYFESVEENSNLISGSTTIPPGIVTWTTVDEVPFRPPPSKPTSTPQNAQSKPPLNSTHAPLLATQNWVEISVSTHAPTTTNTEFSETFLPVSTITASTGIPTTTITSIKNTTKPASLSTTTTNLPTTQTQKQPVTTINSTEGITSTTEDYKTTTMPPVTVTTPPATLPPASTSTSNSTKPATAGNATSNTSSTESPTASSTKPSLQENEIDGYYNTTNFREVCGRRIYPQSRIVGGEKATFGKWPWQISLRQWRTSTYLHKCGAALLNENWAITAAHCVENVPPSDLLLRLGEHDLSVENEPYSYQERRVQIVASHPQFDPRTFEYDLALLRFYEPVAFQPNIIPICVPEDDSNFVGSTAFVTGWGRLYENGPLPSVLQEVSVPVINNSVCETMYRAAGYIEHIPEIFICAGWRKGGFDSCEGDSGGPMVIQRADRRWLLAGVISWGIGCAEPNQPGVYTRISEFREWINQILQF